MNYKFQQVSINFNKFLRILLTSLIINQSIPAISFAGNPESVGLGISIKPDDIPPEQISDISLKPSLSDSDIPLETQLDQDFKNFNYNDGGWIRIEWLAPHEDATQGGKVAYYTVKYSTLSIADVAGSTETWWNQAKQVVSSEFPEKWGIRPRKMPGERDSVIITGLEKAQYYWFAIAARDEFVVKNVSYDVFFTSAQPKNTYAMTSSTPPAKITDLVASRGAVLRSVNLSWSCPGNDDYSGKIVDGRYKILYSTDSSITPALWLIEITTKNVYANQPQSFLITGLEKKTTYYFKIITRDEWPNNWSKDSNIAGIIPRIEITSPPAVSNLFATSYASSDVYKGSYIKLSWKNPSGDFNGVWIASSTYDYPQSTSTAIEIKGLSPDSDFTTYFYQLLPRTSNYYTVWTFYYDEFEDKYYWSSSSTAKGFTDKDILPPDIVSNLTGLPDADKKGSLITLSWTNPVKSGHKNIDFGGVGICYSTTTFPSSTAYATIVNYPSNTKTFTSLTPLTTYYFSVWSFDEVNNYSVEFASVSVFTVAPLIEPEAVSALTAWVDASSDVWKGSFITLKWTNPEGDETGKGFMGVRFNGVKIAYSTIDYQNDFYKADVELTGLTAFTTSTYTFYQLIPRTTYYFTVWSMFKRGDEYFWKSSATISGFTYKDILSPDDVSNFSVDYFGIKKAQIKLSWTNPDTSKYQNMDFKGVRILTSAGYFVNVDGTEYIFKDLPVNSTYNFVIQTYDEADNYSTGITTSVYVEGIAFVTTGLKDRGFEVSFDFKKTRQYNISISTIPGSGQTFSIYTSTYTFDAETNLYPLYYDSLLGLTEYFRLQAWTTHYVNIQPQGYQSEVIDFYVEPLEDDEVPVVAGLVKAKIDYNKHKISWAKVKLIRKPNGELLLISTHSYRTEIDRYEIWRSTDVESGWSLIKSLPASITYYYDLQVSTSALYYYKIYTLDFYARGRNNLRADRIPESAIAATDGRMVLFVGGGKLILSPVTVNRLKESEYMVELTRDESQEKKQVLRSYEIGGLRESDRKKVDFRIDEGANFEISLKVEAGKVKTPPAPSLPVENIDKNLGVVWWNMHEWLRLGGSVNVSQNKVNVKVTIYQQGKYQLWTLEKPDKLTAEVRPKIITPNGDGINDWLTIRFFNPSGNPVDIKIFDITGGVVKDFGSVASDSNNWNAQYWKCDDDIGSKVPPGIYIYQIVGDGKVVNGTVVVER